MEKKINKLYYLIYITFFIIIGRLFILQIIDYDYYNEILNKRNTKYINIESPRGRILDCNNKVIVDNKLVYTIIYQNINNRTREEQIKLAYKMINYLELDYYKLSINYLKEYYLLNNEDIIINRIDNKIIKDYHNKLINNKEFYKIKKDMIKEEDLLIYNDNDKKAIYLYYLMNNGNYNDEKIIKTNCKIEEYLYFSENNSNLDGFNTKYLYEREYIYGDTLKNILGTVSYIPIEKKDYYLNKGYSLNNKVGTSNLEYIYDDYLRGEDEVYRVINNERYKVREGVKGNDLYLTINIELQQYTDNILKEEIIKAKKNYSTKYYNHSYIVISDTYGGVLTMSGIEYINGNLYDRSLGTITDTVIVGSAIKASSMLLGYKMNKIKIGERIKDECIKIKNTPKKCSVYEMGYINDIEALAKSSNVYQFKIAIRIGNGIYKYNNNLNLNNDSFNIYREFFNKFGLGVKTEIDLLNESSGYKGNNISPGLLLDFSIGQYDTYTTMQLNQYISTIARDGKRYKMHLINKISKNNKDLYKYNNIILNEIDVEQKYIDRVKKGLREVIKNGTGRGYFNSNLDISGKTGTSESFYNNVNTNSISLVAYYPSNNPKVSISMTSPNISNSNYIYNINKKVMNRLSNKIDYFVK